MLQLNLTGKLVLLAVIVETGYGRRLAGTGRIYRRYAELSRLVGVEPVTQRRVLDVLKDLAKEGVLWAKVGNLGRHGRTTVVKLLALPATLCPVLVEDLLVGEVAEEVCRDANPTPCPPHFCGGSI